MGLLELEVVQLLVGVGGTHTGCKWLEVPLLLLYLLLLLLWIQPPSTECCRWVSWSWSSPVAAGGAVTVVAVVGCFLAVVALGEGPGRRWACSWV